ncbi:MAG TPA: M20/M25/M40 family metallo-hydrolase [Kofleriaceae bacterium]|nr:M20/M25/M40 family metallo-hydrolase [Kofleriaceae bacterium]
MRRALLVALVACGGAATQVPAPAWVSDTSTYGPHPHDGATIADRYHDVAARIIAATRGDRAAYDRLAELTDTIGHRLSGSPELDRAILWATRALQDDGLAAHTERVLVPHWVRGNEAAAIVAPTARPLHLIGLGGSISTPKGGITAPVVVVHDWAELDAAGDRVKGAIVVYDVAMPAWTEQNGSGYGEVVPYRFAGASQAAKRGAVAALVRSVTAHSLRTAHTGAMVYDDKLPKIPAAALTVEDTELLARLAARGPVTVHLELESQMLPDAESANVIGELRGRELPDQVVVIGAHLDSWDVGQGAHDDGAGVVTMIEAAHVLERLGLVPRRTIRVVLFTNEENGGRGGKGYATAHQAELAKTVLAVESDSGGFWPRGFSVGHKDADAAIRLRARVADIASLLAGLGVHHVAGGHGGADISPMEPAGVPQIGLEVDNRTYFDIHHTEADTLDKVDPAQLADDVAAVAVLAYIAADLPERLDAP